MPYTILSTSYDLLQTRTDEFYCGIGSLLVFLGLAIYEGLELSAIKILLVGFFIFLTSPTATHAMAWSAYKNKVVPGVKETKT